MFCNENELLAREQLRCTLWQTGSLKWVETWLNIHEETRWNAKNKVSIHSKAAFQQHRTGWSVTTGHNARKLFVQSVSRRGSQWLLTSTPWNKTQWYSKLHKNTSSQLRSLTLMKTVHLWLPPYYYYYSSLRNEFKKLGRTLMQLKCTFLKLVSEKFERTINYSCSHCAPLRETCQNTLASICIEINVNCN